MSQRSMAAIEGHRIDWKYNCIDFPIHDEQGDALLAVDRDKRVRLDQKWDNLAKCSCVL